MYNEKATLKPLIIRMKIFNTQIFDMIFENHCKDNADMNYDYLDKNFTYLENMIDKDNSISECQYLIFLEQYNNNLQKLYSKKLE